MLVIKDCKVEEECIVAFRCGNEVLRAELRTFTASGRYCLIDQTYKLIVIDKRSPNETTQFNAQLAISTATEATFGLVKFWINQYTLSHQICLAERPLSLPTRLIDIGEGQEGLQPRFCVLNSSDTTLPYITLGNAWGSGNIFSLTSENIEALKIRIPIHELSRTFQVAMIITR